MTLDGIHSYDGAERCFRHTDPNPTEGRQRATRLLGLSQTPSGELQYDLSYYSGGIGVLDELAIALDAEATLWPDVVNALEVQPVDEATLDSARISELIWLFTCETAPVPLRAAAIAFINDERQPFQDECSLTSQIFMTPASNVNDWTIIWGDATRLNYLGFSQG